MSEWAAKRFWTDAAAVPEGAGFAIQLDGRPVRTPGKTLLTVPSETMAQIIAAEWQAQEETINPLSMPMTRSANSAIDKVTPQITEVADLIAAYGGSDLLCYRADKPDALVARQAAAWDPLLAWSEADLDAPLAITQGVMPVDQPPQSLAVLRARVHGLDPFTLTGFHDLVSLSGSLVLGFAVLLGRLTPIDAWSTSRIDELWQEEKWGPDEEAAQRTAARQADFLHAARVCDLSSDRS